MSEMIGYMNDALEFIESYMQNINFGRSFFRKKTYIPFVKGQNLYDLPEDLYGFKINSVIVRRKGEAIASSSVYRYHFDNSGNASENFENYRSVTNIGRAGFDTSMTKRYYSLFHSDPGHVQIELYPVDFIDGEYDIALDYQRECNKIKLLDTGEYDLDQICDLPRFDSIIKDYVLTRIKNKEEGMYSLDPTQIQALEVLIVQKLKDTGKLTNDATEEKIELDTDFYESSV